MEKEAENIISQEKTDLSKLQMIVKKSIEEENLIIENLLHPPAETMTIGQKVSDKVARFGGSWSFILSFLFILVIWICINSFLAVDKRFDPYPFILMNLILSCVAALQAPIIMMSQNRQEEKDKKQNENDYMINMKAELEIKALHQKIDLLLEDQIKVLFDSQAQQLELLKKIEAQINKK